MSPGSQSDRAPAGASLAERAISRAAGSRPVPGNRVSVLADGPEVFPAMLEMISAADRWIHFENYIIRSDATGWRFAEALGRRARAGLRVSVLYDWLGSVTTSRRLWAWLRRQGVAVRAFNPPRLVDLFSNITRDHRKLVVADGSSAILGGICIGDEWAGRPEAGVSPWRDAAVSINGPAAAVLDQSFATVWRLAGPALPPEELAHTVPPAGHTVVQVVSGRPGRGRIYRIVELLAAGASERLWITDAYLVAPRPLLFTLRNAACEGVDVRLLVPGTSDISLVRNLTRIGYRDLLGDGVRIWEWRGPMLHAKTQVTDGRWSRIGSSNLNPASLLGNYELDVIVDDRGVAEQLERRFRRDITQGSEIVLDPGNPAWYRLRRRGPRRARLAARQPDSPASPHRATLRERRSHAVLTVRAVATGARRSLYLPLVGALAVLAGLFVAAPRIMGYSFGALLGWLAVAAWLEGFRRRTTAGGTGQAGSTKPGGLA